MQKKYGNDKGFLLVALSDEPVDTVKPFVKKQKINYIVGSDAKSSFKDFGIKGYPTIFVIDKNGEVVYKGHDPAEAEGAVEDEMKKSPPKATTPLGSGAARAELAKADKLFESGDYAKALAAYEKIAKVQNDNDVGKKAKAQVEKIKSDKKLLAAVREAEAKKKCEDWLNMARTLAKSGKTEDAARYYQKVLDEYPDTPFAETARRELARL